MNFKPGQKVLCVNDHFRTYCTFPVVKGTVYTISGTYTCACGSSQVILKERPLKIDMNCRCGFVSCRRQSFYDWRFIPIEYFERFIGFSDINSIHIGNVKSDPEIKKEVIKSFIDPEPRPLLNFPERFRN